MDLLDYYSKHPFLSEEACHYLVEIGVKLVGFDAPMPDNPENGKGSIKDFQTICIVKVILLS